MPSSSESRPRRVRSRSSRRRSRSDRRRSPPRRRDSRDRRDRRDSRDRRPSPRDRRSRSRERPERPASRSRSRKRPTVTPGGGIETVEVKVVDARTRHSGEQTFQAEIYLGLDAAAAGRQRTMCVRGPCRVDKSQAQEDADKMEDASRDGMKAVREVAAKMKRARISTTPA
ncbi:unnamed protein product [Durusdinium trenchii]|uniref:Uncharacterized protein n=2 Tax=Durusdinium trenchii TaxID=1381693 RepID=A0ABP0KPY9_9DINO